MSEEIARVAAGLTEAQRRALVEAEWRGSGECTFAVVPCIGVSPLPASLSEMLTLRWDKLTTKGLAVRQHLMEQNR